MLFLAAMLIIAMTAAAPYLTTQIKRDREIEMIHRGEQYARAIGLFQRKFANAAPPNIDVLVEQRFLRKKYKDPITNDDFQLIYANQQQNAGQVTAGSQAGAAGSTSGIVQTQGQQVRPPSQQIGGPERSRSVRGFATRPL